MCLLITSIFTGCSDKDVVSSTSNIPSSSNESTILDEDNTTTENNEERKDITSSNSNSSSSSENNTSNNNTTISSNENTPLTENNEGNLNVASYRYEPVNFEISDSVIFQSGSSTAPFVYNHKYGLIGSDGKVILEPIYKSLSHPSNGYLLAEQEDGSILIMNEQGVEQTKINYTKPLDLSGMSSPEFVNGYSFLGLKERDSNSPQTVIINTEGKVLFETNLTRITITDKNVIIGLDYVSDRGNPSVVGIDTNGNQLWNVTVMQFPNNNQSIEVKDNLLVYKSKDNNLWGAIDVNGNQVLECKYEELSYAGDGLIGVLKYGKWGYMDYSGNIVIEPQFTSVDEFIKGKALVKKDGNYCVIDTQGNVLFELANNSASHYDNGLFYNQSDSDMKLLDENGNTIFEIPLSFDYIDRSGLKYHGGDIFYTINQSNGERTYQHYKLIKN